MSRDFIEDYLEHSWGKSPEQKKREKEYNRQYYLNNKERWSKHKQHAFKGQKKKEYNAEYYKKNRDKWKQTYKDTNKFYRDLRKKAVKQGHESMPKRRATLTAANEAAKARAIAEKQYGIFKRQYAVS